MDNTVAVLLLESDVAPVEVHRRDAAKSRLEPVELLVYVYCRTTNHTSHATLAGDHLSIAATCSTT